MFRIQPAAHLPQCRVGLFTAAAVAGTVVGGMLSHRIGGKALRRGLGLFVLTIAGYLLYRELNWQVDRGNSRSPGGTPRLPVGPADLSGYHGGEPDQNGPAPARGQPCRVRTAHLHRG
jgi:hypothetical protein